MIDIGAIKKANEERKRYLRNDSAMEAIDQLVAELENSRLISRLEQRAAYWQIERRTQENNQMRQEITDRADTEGSLIETLLAMCDREDALVAEVEKISCKLRAAELARENLWKKLASVDTFVANF